LQAVVDKASQTPNDPAAANSTRPPADAARQQTRQIAQAFMLDNSEYKTHEQVKKILDDPITSLEAMVRGMGPDQLNAAGRSLCAQFSQLTNKFPFNPESRTDATLAEMAALLKPKEGAIWTFYEQRLKTHLKREGPDFAPSPESPFPLNAGFVNWFNQVVRFSESVYPSGAADPKLAYSLQWQPSDQIQSMRLNIDGQSANFSGTNRGATTQFTWPGAGKREANIEATLSGGSATGMFQQEGLWAVFHFFAEADSFSPVGSGYMIEWRPVSGTRREPMRVGGKPLVYRFLLDTKGAPPVFSKSYLTTLRCVSPVAR
jgi:type VI protein secretion system component VasK